MKDMERENETLRRDTVTEATEVARLTKENTALKVDRADRYGRHTLVHNGHES